MTPLWWEITGAAAFGQVTLVWSLREAGPFELLRLTRDPGLALLVQAVALLLLGTSATGIALSFAFGAGTLLVAGRLHRHRDDDDKNPYRSDS